MKTLVQARGVDKELWLKFRAKAVELGITTAEALEEAISVWLRNQKSI